VVYLNAGDDLDGAVARVEAAGGKVLLGKTRISEDIGSIAHFLDTEGNRVALHSPR
jgi:predicted enzyme related to lactoylglutathione lyase